MEATIEKILKDIGETPLTEREKIMVATLEKNISAETILEIILQNRGFV